MKFQHFGAVVFEAIAMSVLLVGCSASTSVTKEPEKIGAKSLPTTFDECIRSGGFRLSGLKGDLCRLGYAASGQPEQFEICRAEGFPITEVQSDLRQGAGKADKETFCVVRIYKGSNEVVKDKP